MAKEKRQKGQLRKEFVAFIARGNVLDMAVGVIIGGAFNAIVTSLVSILMSVATWWVPGGIKGLVSVLPAANDMQKGMNEALGLGQKFAASDLQTLATKLAVETYGQSTVDATPTLIENVKSTILGKYTIHGTQYTYNLSAVIDWGSFINAIISFIIIGFTLFVIVKVAAKMTAMREEMKAKIQAKVQGEPKAEETAE